MVIKEDRLTLDDVSGEGRYTEAILEAQYKINSFCQNDRSDIWISESETIAGLASRALGCTIVLDKISFIELRLASAKLRLDGEKDSEVIFTARTERFKSFADQFVSIPSIDNNYIILTKILRYLRKSYIDIQNTKTQNFNVDKLLSPDLHYFQAIMDMSKTMVEDQYDMLLKGLQNPKSVGHREFRVYTSFLKTCLFLYARVLPITLPINPSVMFRIDSACIDLSHMVHTIIERVTWMLHRNDLSRRKRSTKIQNVEERRSRALQDICIVMDSVGLENMPEKPNPLFEKMDEFWKEIKDKKIKLELSYTPPYNLEKNNRGDFKGARTFVDDLKEMKVTSGEKRTLTVNYQKIINLALQINSK